MSTALSLVIVACCVLALWILDNERRAAAHSDRTKRRTGND